MTVTAVARITSPRWVWSSALVILLGATLWVLVVLEEARPGHRRAEELAYLPKGEYLKVAVLGYREAVADLIWLKVVQHLGGRKPSLGSYLWAYHAADVLTDLDPRFAQAYRATGTVLGVWAERPHESIAILSKGIRHNPQVWDLPFYVGYDYYYVLRNPAEAAKYFRLASSLQGSPAYLPRLAARMTVEAGDPDAALEFLQRLYSGTQDDKIREGLVRRIREVEAERGIRLLEEAARRFKHRFGKWPLRLEELIARGIIVSLPIEPFGGVYEWHPADGTVTSSGLKERLRVHRHS